MYKGIGKYIGLTVTEEDAFSVACEKCKIGTDDEKFNFMYIAWNAENMEDFESMLVEWFYSGDWIHK
ncbi:hypothetical protein ACTQ6A_13790 [Lachnospiraceae bacterium LCP25S3_G4]